MENTLVEMTSSFIELTDEEKQGILEAFPIKHIQKKRIYLKKVELLKMPS